MAAKRQRQIPGWLSVPLTLGAFGALVWLERRRPLRQAVESPDVHDMRNLAVAALAGAGVGFAERPVVEPLARRVERARLGLLPAARLPAWLEVAAAAALMDYTLYAWHYLNHRVASLWRFHLPHHVDLDLTASTALRFHFGELLVGVPWRAAQVLLIGVTPRSLSVWRLLLFLSVMFHHSNLRLPPAFERRLGRFVVTPRLHGIHHSAAEAEMNSNWSSGLTVWDWLHGTLRRDVPQAEITVGVPAYRERREVSLRHVVALPFAAQRPTWGVAGKN
jgi:sterol desaturase/sphingolipid hydroxylase (fatty acid hydroxylase superfamily)